MRITVYVGWLLAALGVAFLIGISATLINFFYNAGA